MFFRGKLGCLIAYLGISALVLGGLGWATKEALRLEEEQHAATQKALRLEEDKRIAAEKELKLVEEKRKIAEDGRTREQLYRQQSDLADQVRLALWRLDTRLMPALAREDSRPYAHYVALHCPFPALTCDGQPSTPGQFYLPSPLMTAEIPPWMILHFQIDTVNGWMSPQVIPESLKTVLRKQPLELCIDNANDPRAQQLTRLKKCYPAHQFLKSLKERGVAVEDSQLQKQIELNLKNLANTQQGFTGRNTVDQPTGRMNPPSQGQGGQLNTANSANPNYSFNDPQDPLRRYQMTYRAKTENPFTFWNEGRHIEPLDNGYSGKTLKSSQPIDVRVGSMRPLWLPNSKKPENLLMLRPVLVGNIPAFQGILLDWDLVSAELKKEIADEFPNAKLIPLPEGELKVPEHSMTALPVEFDPGVPSFQGEIPLPPANESQQTGAEQETISETRQMPELGWTGLRIGLLLAWVAVMVALLAVGLGGWSLLDLSERRIRFVSAVTHELRTPLTTLRLYLDLLTSGMVSEEQQRKEYLQTLNGEAERLYRLINNVLDFARLEKSRPTVVLQRVAVGDLLEQVSAMWLERCTAARKDLQIVNALPADTAVCTDRNLIEQILGNLIDNACKYSQDATDNHIWLRAVVEDKKLCLEVEDRGPGVAKMERYSIFRAFRRGHDADVKAGGVGLGLALGTRWAALVGGRLAVRAGEGGVGACFKVELPL
jgi:signal transduction histidine kinase